MKLQGIQIRGDCSSLLASNLVWSKTVYCQNFTEMTVDFKNGQNIIITKEQLEKFASDLREGK